MNRKICNCGVNCKCVEAEECSKLNFDIDGFGYDLMAEFNDK